MRRSGLSRGRRIFLGSLVVESAIFLEAFPKATGLRAASGLRPRARLVVGGGEREALSISWPVTRPSGIAGSMRPEVRSSCALVRLGWFVRPAAPAVIERTQGRIELFEQRCEVNGSGRLRMKSLR